MEIALRRSGWKDQQTPLLVLALVEGNDPLDGAPAEVDQALDGQLSAVRRRGDFKGKEGQTLILYPRQESSFERVLVVGLGKADDLDAEKVRRAGGTAAKQAARLEASSLVILLPAVPNGAVPPGAAARALAEGLRLGSYSFDEFKSKEGDESKKSTLERVEIVASGDKAEEVDEGVRVGSAIGRGANLARTLGNLPGNVATPEYLAQTAREIGDRYGMKVTVLGPEEMEKEGLRTILAVSKGSSQEPRLIILEHRRGKGGKPIALVGKGLTFDAGGISIKPAAGMEEMKFDMCGGAAVLGAMQAIGELEVAADVVAVIPSSENLLSGDAMKPGDIIHSHQGKSIEVINTDAEGRLILADALSFLQRYEPEAVVDAATLTGSCVVALGHHATGAFGNDESLLDEVRGAGDRAGERVWPLPMFKEYRDQIKSDYADIKNSGGRPAGAITAAWFLREFVGDTPWVHLDIAGTAYGDGKISYLTKGATGAPARLFVEWVLARAG